MSRGIEKLYDILQDIRDRIQDEGDRAYLGSTNDVQAIERICADLLALALKAPTP